MLGLARFLSKTLFLVFTGLCIGISIWMIWPVEVNEEPPEGIVCISPVQSQMRTVFWGESQGCHTEWGEVSWHYGAN